MGVDAEVENHRHGAEDEGRLHRHLGGKDPLRHIHAALLNRRDHGHDEKGQADDGKILRLHAEVPVAEAEVPKGFFQHENRLGKTSGAGKVAADKDQKGGADHLKGPVGRLLIVDGEGFFHRVKSPLEEKGQRDQSPVVEAEGDEIKAAAVPNADEQVDDVGGDG